MCDDVTMATVPLQLFQAAATVIPTLLIAFVIGAKSGDRVAKAAALLPSWSKITTAIFLICMATLILVGEMAALRALLRGYGGGILATLAFMTIWILIVAIGIEFLLPTLEGLPTATQLMLIYALIFLGSGVCFTFLLSEVLALGS